MVLFRWYTIPLVATVIAVSAWATASLGNFLPAGLLPIQLTAGVAVAVLLINSWRSWPGVFLGVYGVSWWLASADATVSALWAAATVTLQAVLGALLVRNLLRDEQPLARTSQVVRMLVLAGPVACFVSVLGCQLASALTPQLAALQFCVDMTGGGDGLMVWSANTLGVLVAMPSTLALWPVARTTTKMWGARVVMPLVVAGLLVVVGHVAVLRFEMREVAVADAMRRQAVLDSGMRPFEQGLETLRSIEQFFLASVFVTVREFAVFTDRLLTLPGLDSLEWVPRVTAGKALLGSEAGGVRSLQWVGGRDEPFDGEELVRAPPGPEDYYPALYVAPAAASQYSTIVDYRGFAPLWAAMRKARDSAAVTAAGAEIRLPSGELEMAVFLPLYAAGFDSSGADVESRRVALQGFIKGLFTIDTLLEPLMLAADRQGVRLALVDITPGSPAVTLLSNLAVDTPARDRQHFKIADRLFQLELAMPATAALGAHPLARLYQGFSVLALLLIGLALLTSAGHQRAAQATVMARTAALRASERRLEVTLDSIGDGVLVADTRGCVTRLNPMAEQLTDWSLQSARGQPLQDVLQLVSEDDYQPVVVPSAEALAARAGSGQVEHLVLISRSGTERVIALSTAAIVDADGEAMGVVLTFHDISEDRAVERALAASERRYRELIEEAPYGIIVQTRGCFVYLNPRARQLLGARDQAELVGKPVLDFLDLESREVVRERMRQLNLFGIPAEPLEEQWVRLDGSVLYAEAMAVAYSHEGERGALVMLQDISARKTAEIQRDRFFDLSLDPQCIIDAEGHFVRVNIAFSEVLGWPAQTFLEGSYLDLVHPEDRAEASTAYRSVHEGGSDQTFEVRFRHAAGGWRWLSWSMVAAEQDNLVYAVARDVTDRREIIEALTRAHQEADYANRAKSAFLATISHEIRTPMNAVISLADVLSYSDLDQHEAELVRNIHSSARSLLRLIDDILDFSKIEAGRLELEREPVAIEALIEDMCQALQPGAEGKNVSLSVFIDPELPTLIIGDETRLRQLLNNLIGNAIKFSVVPETSGPGLNGRVRVTVEADADGTTLCVVVADNGIGMSQDTLAHIFQPFSQGELSTTRRYGGTGLGLAISRRLIDLMGGTIHFDSSEGQGTRVTVTLPLAPGPAVAMAVPDLSGLLVLMVPALDEVDADWQRYLQSAGATTVRSPSLDAALACQRNGVAGRIIVADLRVAAQSALPESGLVTADAAVCWVLVNGGQRGRLRVQSEQVVVLEGGNPRRSQLLKAVAVAAGRLSSTEVISREGVALAAAPLSLSPGPPRILVVEDDDMNRKVIVEQLRLLGYTADLAENGAMALALWRQRGYELILTDLRMPVMDGYGLVQSLRAEERPWMHTPVVALSANTMRDDHSDIKLEGFDDYLAKPVALDVLAAVLNYWLAGRAADGSGDEPAAASLYTTARTANNNDAARELGEINQAKGAGALLDVAVLKGFIGDDEARANKFLNDYQAAARRLQVEIVRARERDDLHAVASFAHRLKSSSRWVGALRLGTVCERLEQAGGEGSRPHLDKILADFTATLERTLALISEHLDAPAQ